jgi:hypothetical protein
MGNKLDVNVDTKLRTPPLAVFAGSVIGNVHKALSCCLVLLKAVTWFWRQLLGPERDNLEEERNVNETFVPQWNKLLFILKDSLLKGQ